MKRLRETLCYFSRVLGYAVVFSSLSLTLLTLYRISTQGYFKAVEPRPLLLIAEFFLVFYGFIFAISLLKMEVKP